MLAGPGIRPPPGCPVQGVAAAGVPYAHLRALRHTGGTLSATTRELMAWPGHSCPRDAAIHRHATRDREKSIAVALGKFLDVIRDGSR